MTSRYGVHGEEVIRLLDHIINHLTTANDNLKSAFADLLSNGYSYTAGGTMSAMVLSAQVKLSLEQARNQLEGRPSKSSLEPAKLGSDLEEFLNNLTTAPVEETKPETPDSPLTTDA